MSIIKDIQHAAKHLQRGWKSRPSAISDRQKFRMMQQQAFKSGMAAVEGAKRPRNEWYPSDGNGNVGNYYPAAEVGRFRNDWITRVVTSTTLLRLSFRTLCARSEFAYRTDPYAKRAVNILRTFVVGSGIRPFPNVKNANGTPVEGINKQLAEDWKRFNDQGTRIGSQPVSIYEAQGIEFETQVQLGSNLRVRVKSRPGSWLPFAYSMVKPYRLNFAFDNYFDDLYYQMTIGKGPTTILGQIFNEYQEPIGYHILGENGPISADRMTIHYRQVEAEQYLGIPWMTCMLGDIWDIQQLLDDKLTQSRILSRMGVWIDKGDKADFAGALDSSGSADEEESIPFDRETLCATKSKPEPIQFDDKISESLSPLMLLTLHRIAIGGGFSYQLLTSDLNGASFSGSRTNVITDSKVFSQLFHGYVRSNCQTMWNDFVEWEFLTGKLAGATYAQYLKDPWYYNQCYFLPEETDWIDPLKDAQAQRMLYMTGQITLEELVAGRGKDWKHVVDQRAKEKEYINSKDLQEMLPAFSDRSIQAALEIDNGEDPAQKESDQTQKGGNNL